MSTPRKRGPQKANAAAKAALARLPQIPPELLDSLVKGPMTPEAVQDASLAFNKALIERALGAEMNHHLRVTFRRIGAGCFRHIGASVWCWKRTSLQVQGWTVSGLEARRLRAEGGN